MNNSSGIPFETRKLLKDTILSVLYTKREIVSLLADCELASIKDLEANYDELSRAKILDYFFDKANEQGDVGLGKFRRLIQKIYNWDIFDGYFFSNGSLNSDKAREKVSSFKSHVDDNDSFQRGYKEHRKEYAESVLRKKSDLSQIKMEYELLMQGKDLQGKIIDAQARGYALEKIFSKLARIEDILVHESFRVNREQIDGAIKIDGEYYIVEIKWKSGGVSNSDLYSFVPKIQGKFYGRGVFVSINGFDVENIEDLLRGKPSVMILVDGYDIKSVLCEEVSFLRMMQLKIAAAQTKGIIYYDSIKSIKK